MATRIREICLDANNQPIPRVMKRINARMSRPKLRFICFHCRGPLVFRFTNRKGGRSGDPIIQCRFHMERVAHPKSTIFEAYDPRFLPIFQPEFDLFDTPSPEALAQEAEAIARAIAASLPKPKPKRKRKRRLIIVAALGSLERPTQGPQPYGVL